MIIKHSRNNILKSDEDLRYRRLRSRLNYHLDRVRAAKYKINSDYDEDNYEVYRLELQEESPDCELIRDFTRVCKFCSEDDNELANYDMPEEDFIDMIKKRAQSYANKTGKTVHVIGQSINGDGKDGHVDLGFFEPEINNTQSKFSTVSSFRSRLNNLKKKQLAAEINKQIKEANLKLSNNKLTEASALNRIQKYLNK